MAHRILTATELEATVFEWEEESYVYALLVDEFVILLIEDHKLTNSNMNHLIEITGGEIVKLIGHSKCRTIRILSGMQHEVNPQVPISPKMAAKMQRIPMNPPFEVNIASSILPERKFTDIRSIYTVGGRIIPFLDQLNQEERGIFCRTCGATEYRVQYEVEQTFTGTASQYRSIIVEGK